MMHAPAQGFGKHRLWAFVTGQRVGQARMRRARLLVGLDDFFVGH